MSVQRPVLAGMAIAACAAAGYVVATRNPAPRAEEARTFSVDAGVVGHRTQRRSSFTIVDAGAPGAVPRVRSRSCSCLSVEFDPPAVTDLRELRGSVKLKPDREGDVSGRVVIDVGGATVELRLAGFVVPELRSESGSVVVTRDTASGRLRGEFAVLAFGRPGRPSLTAVHAQLLDGVGTATVGQVVRTTPHRGGEYQSLPVAVEIAETSGAPRIRVVGTHVDLGELELTVPVRSAPTSDPAVLDAGSAWAIVEHDGSIRRTGGRTSAAPDPAEGASTTAATGASEALADPGATSVGGQGSGPWFLSVRTAADAPVIAAPVRRSSREVREFLRER